MTLMHGNENLNYDAE